MDDEVTAYTTALHEKEQHLGDLHTSLSKQLRESHITEVVRQNKQNRKAIETAQKLTTGECRILRQMVVTPSGLFLNCYAKVILVFHARESVAKLIQFFLIRA